MKRTASLRAAEHALNRGAALGAHGAFTQTLRQRNGVPQAGAVFLDNLFEDLQGTDELFRTMLPNVERDLNGEGLLYYGTEYPVAQKGSVRSNAALF